MSRRVLLTMVVAVLGLLVSQASADLIIDVSAADGAPLDTPSGIKAVLVNPGETVTLEVFGLIENSPGGDSFTSAEGSLMSGAGPLLGDLANHTVNGPYAGGSAGVQQDLPIAAPDGDMDYGRDGVNTGHGDLVWYRKAGIDPVAGSVHPLATVEFTASGNPGEKTEVNWSFATPAGFNQNPSWAEDGVGKNAMTGTYRSGAPVVVEVIPEPGTLILLGMGALVLLARRRRR